MQVLAEWLLGNRNVEETLEHSVNSTLLDMRNQTIQIQALANSK